MAGAVGATGIKFQGGPVQAPSRWGRAYRKVGLSTLRGRGGLRPSPTMEEAMRQYPEREIYAYGRYIQCQILNWWEGKPPQYLICNPLDADYREPFLARQGMGTWMRIDLLEIEQQLNQRGSS